MKNKYLNDALVGNENMVVSFSKTGELLRLFYPTRDYRQFVEEFYTGVKVNDSALIYLHEDINNQYHQYYTKDTNILQTQILNTYFNLEVLQTDFVCMKKNVLVKKYKFINHHSIDLNVHFLLYSNLFSSFNNVVGSRVENDFLLQYSHNYVFSIFSKHKIESYRLNNSRQEIQSGILQDKDYEGMARDSAISYEIGTLKPGEASEITIFITIHESKAENQFDQLEANLQKIKRLNVEKEEEEAISYWRNYVASHDRIGIFDERKKDGWVSITGSEENFEQTKKVYTRSILLFPFLQNPQTGGISAALEVDEEKDKCGRYSYCWPRDAVFTARALDLLKMNQETTAFYTEFAPKTQNKKGDWEQRFYTDERTAPCWGYQIDETASIVYGVYEHYKVIKDKKFLEKTFDMCYRATEYLKKYVQFIEKGKTFGKYKFEKNESYDLWEMTQGVHLYSMATIYGAFNSMAKIYNQLITKKNEQETQDRVNELFDYARRVKAYCLENLCDPETHVLRRNNKDAIMDISILAAITPFKMFKVEDKEVKNTIEKMNLTLRTYTGGYIRFEGDSYLGGNNPWPVATLWMAIYDMVEGNLEKAKQEIDFVTQTATEHGFLAEQIDNQTMSSKWVIGLAWSHAMYVVALSIYSFFEFGHF